MFTGIIQALGRIIHVENFEHITRLHIQTTDHFLQDVQLGDSIAIEGACMTVCAMNPSHQVGVFIVDVSIKSLELIVPYALYDWVNVEKSLRLQDFIGGHMVSGHVDGQAKIIYTHLQPDQSGMEMHIAMPAHFSPYMVHKGSVTVAGISLTINAVRDNVAEGACVVELYFIPHTLMHTSLQYKKVGDCVNIEIDLIARYLKHMYDQQAHAKNHKEQI